MALKKIDKILLGITSAVWVGAAAHVGASLYTEHKANEALTQEARHAIALEEQLEGSVSIRCLIQHPEAVQQYAAIQQEYDALMTKPEVRESLEESKSYTNVWYYNERNPQCSVFLLGGMTFVLGIFGMAYRQEKKREEQAKAKTE